MSKPYQRTPRGYDGPQTTSHKVADLLPGVLAKISDHFQIRPDLILLSWPDIVGPKIAPMTQAVSFNEGLMVVKVKNSTLFTLLQNNERPKLLSLLRRRFPNVEIKNLQFRLG